VSSPFAQPSAGGEQFEPKDFLGALVLIYPKSYNPNDTTKHGQTTSADVDVVVVDRQDPQTGGPVIKRNARLFGNLANSVRDSIGSVVLGRIGQTPTNKGNPAWILANYTEQDAAMAVPVDTAWKAGQFAQAAPQQQPQQYQQQPPPQQQYGGPPAQQYPPQGQAWGQQPQAPAQAPPQGQPDLWAGQQQYGAQPPAQAPAQQQYGGPPPAAGPEDPNIAALIAKGLPEAQVRAMDPQTRAGVLATYGG
jgi:hypothetical protein